MQAKVHAPTTMYLEVGISQLYATYPFVCWYMHKMKTYTMSREPPLIITNFNYQLSLSRTLTLPLSPSLFPFSLTPSLLAFPN